MDKSEIARLCAEETVVTNYRLFGYHNGKWSQITITTRPRKDGVKPHGLDNKSSN